MLFNKKRTYVITYEVHGPAVVERTFIVKAQDIAHAMKILDSKELYPISLIEYERLDKE